MDSFNDGNYISTGLARRSELNRRSNSDKFLLRQQHDPRLMNRSFSSPIPSDNNGELDQFESQFNARIKERRVGLMSKLGDGYHQRSQKNDELLTVNQSQMSNFVDEQPGMLLRSRSDGNLAGEFLSRDGTSGIMSSHNMNEFENNFSSGLNQNQINVLPDRQNPPGIKKKTTGPVHNSKYKAKLCNNWMTRGVCPYHEKCQFAHGVEEIEKWEIRRQYGPVSSLHNKRENLSISSRELEIRKQQEAQQFKNKIDLAQRKDALYDLVQHLLRNKNTFNDIDMIQLRKLVEPDFIPAFEESKDRLDMYEYGTARTSTTGYSSINEGFDIFASPNEQLANENLRFFDKNGTQSRSSSSFIPTALSSSEVLYERNGLESYSTSDGLNGKENNIYVENNDPNTVLLE